MKAIFRNGFFACCIVIGALASAPRGDPDIGAIQKRFKALYAKDYAGVRRGSKIRDCRQGAGGNDNPIMHVFLTTSATCTGPKANMPRRRNSSSVRSLSGKKLSVQTIPMWPIASITSPLCTPTKANMPYSAKLHRRALAIWEKAYGPNHPDVATSLNNLANVYKDQGKYAEAADLYRRALANTEKALGPSHPDVVHIPALASPMCIRSQGKYAEATELYQRGARGPGESARP